ncbi:hypothetical protein Agub_g8053, partial [Astrephomene gubernaculifera]
MPGTAEACIDPGTLPPPAKKNNSTSVQRGAPFRRALTMQQQQQHPHHQAASSEPPAAQRQRGHSFNAVTAVATVMPAAGLVMPPYPVPHSNIPYGRSPVEMQPPGPPNPQQPLSAAALPGLAVAPSPFFTPQDPGMNGVNEQATAHNSSNDAPMGQPSGSKLCWDQQQQQHPEQQRQPGKQHAGGVSWAAFRASQTYGTAAEPSGSGTGFGSSGAVPLPLLATALSACQPALLSGGTGFGGAWVDCHEEGDEAEGGYAQHGNMCGEEEGNDDDDEIAVVALPSLERLRRTSVALLRQSLALVARVCSGEVPPVAG